VVQYFVAREINAVASGAVVIMISLYYLQEKNGIAALKKILWDMGAGA
jgi:hypothetical protein